jgi:hypothetical protein
MMNNHEILHTYVPPNHPDLTEGDWFFDTGQWCHCASMSQNDNGYWSVDINLVPHWQTTDKIEQIFKTKEDAITSISDYFKSSVRTVSPDEFPSDEEL